MSDQNQDSRKIENKEWTKQKEELLEIRTTTKKK